MGDFEFDSKIKTTGIGKNEFIEKLKSHNVDEKSAKSIFDKLNVNTVGDSAEILDEDEQIGLLALLKNISGDDKKITEEEFKAKSNITGDISMDSFEKVVDSYKELVGTDSKDVDLSNAKKIVLKDNTYEYNDDAVLTQKTVKNGDKSVVLKMREKYEPVKLSENWKMQRAVGNSIANGDEKFKDIKNSTTAKDALDKIIKAKGIDDSKWTEEQKSDLLEMFIKFNPSVFDRDSGNAWINADWTKLDFPEVSDIDSMTSKEGSSVAEASDLITEADTSEIDEKAKSLGYRKTYGQGVYYDEKNKLHYVYDKKVGSFKALDKNIVYVYENGNRRFAYPNADGEKNYIVKNSKEDEVLEMEASTEKEKAVTQLGLRKTYDSKNEIYYSEHYKLHFKWDEQNHKFVAMPEISLMNPNSYFGTDGKLYDRSGNEVKK